MVAYTSCRLIPLDKCPGVRPIGIGEVVRRIIGKAVHAMEHVFAEEDTETIILVDATNAFNRSNRQITLLNCGAVCLSLSYILINTYRDNSMLFVDGQYILSKEDTTQDDPLEWQCMLLGPSP